MKLILTQEVDGLGAPGDVVEVKDGYGRNYLVPRGLAMRWTRGGEKTVESIKARSRLARGPRPGPRRADQDQARGRSPCPCRCAPASGGRLFGAVTTAEIAGALADVSGEQVDKRTHRGRPADQVARRPPGRRSGCTTTCPPPWRLNVIPA